MYNLGKFNKLKILREVDFGMYLVDDEENEVLLPAKSIPSGSRPGDVLDVFVYKDSEDRPVATTNKPKGCVGDIVSLEVVDVNAIGAFLDWGLEKDLFLPFKHQKRKIHLNVYDKVVVKVVHDTVSDRLIASMRIMTQYDSAEEALKIGDAITFRIAETHEHGLIVIINDLYQGMLFTSDIVDRLFIGDTREGYIKNIREDDTINAYLKPVGKTAILNDKELLMSRLRKARDGFLPFNSKTPAEDLQKEFNLSKKAFKKAIGGLYKEKKIVITDDGVKLNK